MFIKQFIKGFYYAGRGFVYTVRRERNFRFHLIASFYVIFFGILGGISRLSWAALFICFGLVIGLELCNTAIERTCNAITMDPNPLIRAAKDAAAAAVLIAAFCSVGVAIAVFGSAELWVRVLNGLLTYPILIVFLLLTLPLSLFFWTKGLPKP